MKPVTLVKTILGIALFGAGIGAGVVAYSGTQSTPDYGPYPPLPEAAEPRAADDLTDLVLAGDDQLIAERYGSEVLGALMQALTFGSDETGMSPIVEIQNIEYLGTVADGREALAMYNAYGTLRNGTEVIAGFAVRVANGEVIGVNQ